MSEIRIHAHRLTDNFTIIPNTIINDSRLTTGERFYLIWALSLPPSWKLNTKSIATILDVGERTVTRYNKKLKEFGYLEIEKLSTGETTWHFFQTKSEADLYHAKPDLEPNRQIGGKGTKSLIAKKADRQIGGVLVSTDLINKKEIYISGIDFKSWPEMPPIELFKDWLKIRKTKKNVNTQYAMDNIAAQLRLAVNRGYSVKQCFETCVIKSWAGFNADWMTDIKPTDKALTKPYKTLLSKIQERYFVSVNSMTPLEQKIIVDAVSEGDIKNPVNLELLKDMGFRL